ncbi:MAG: ABC transporter permease [Lentisphaerae bacterium]|nr:ABC transporter permease [Lentisphaerota bacterium]
MNHSIIKSLSLWQDAWAQLRRNRMAMASLWIILLYLAMALYGEGVYWYFHWKDSTPSYQRTNLKEEYLPPSVFRHPFALSPGADPAGAGSLVTDSPGSPAAPGLAARVRSGVRALAHHPLGTDNLGRDVLQRTVQGARIAFQVGIITSCIAIPIGVFFGCLAGYFGGKTDDFIVWLYSTFSSIPGLLFILAIAMVVGKGLQGVYLGIGLTTWVNLCRLIRGEVIKHKAQPYVRAAQALGFSPWRIMFRHILPNVFHIVIITFSLRFPAAVSTEVFMSFLGIGVQGEPSWGIMISNSRLRLWQGIWWEMTFVTAAIFFIVLAFNLLGDALRDALDPRLRTSEH